MPDNLVVQGREQMADWIETTLLARSTETWAIDSMIALAKRELGLDSAHAQQGLLAMRKRTQAAGPTYPFMAEDLVIRKSAEAPSTAYAALLLLSPDSPSRQLVHRESTEPMERYLEDLAVLAFSALWGPGSRALRFGWPSAEGRPKEFSSAVEWLAKQMGIGVGSGFRPPKRKDGGVDVVAWRPFPDGKRGFPIVLVQCTLQTDITNKAADVDARVWSSWLAMDTDPVAALAIPQVVPSGTTWDRITLQSMLFDRLRLSFLAGETRQAEELRKWTDETLQLLRKTLAGAEQ